MRACWGAPARRVRRTRPPIPGAKRSEPPLRDDPEHVLARVRRLLEPRAAELEARALVEPAEAEVEQQLGPAEEAPVGRDAEEEAQLLHLLGLLAARLREHAI